MDSKRALLIKLGQIGDVIMAIPGAYALHQRGFEIHWVCGDNVASLLHCYSWIHPIVVDHKSIQFGKGLARARSLLDAWYKLAFRKFDLCATLYYDPRYKILALPIHAKKSIAFSKTSRSASLLPSRHPTDEYIRFLLDIEDGFKEGTAPPVPPDLLPPSPLPPKIALRRIAIVPGGVRPLVREQATKQANEQSLRRWPVENFVELSATLLGRGWEVVLLGSSEDSWTQPYFTGLGVVDCLGKLSLPEVISVCNTSDALISPDTGPLHMAGLSNTVVLGIFGPTDPATRIPRRDFSVGLWGGLNFACRPCYDGREFAPCQYNGCIRQVSPAAVLSELDRLLTAKSNGQIEHWRVFFPEEAR